MSYFVEPVCFTIEHLVASYHSTKILCGAACLQQGSICDGYIFDTIFRECIFCSVLALAPSDDDSQVTMKIYVKEDLIEYLENLGEIAGSSK